MYGVNCATNAPYAAAGDLRTNTHAAHHAASRTSAAAEPSGTPAAEPVVGSECTVVNWVVATVGRGGGAGREGDEEPR